MASEPGGAYKVGIRIVEAMGILLLVAIILKWPLLYFPVIPIVLYVLQRRLGITLRRWTWAALMAVALLAYPLSAGPLLKTNIWLAEHGYTSPGQLPTLDFYRPLFRLAKNTSFEKPLWKYTELWLGGFSWNP